MMGKKSGINERDIYVRSGRNHSDKENDEFVYDLCFHGDMMLCSVSADDAREIVACLQNALESNGKGGAK